MQWSRSLGPPCTAPSIREQTLGVDGVAMPDAFITKLPGLGPPRAWAEPSGLGFSKLFGTLTVPEGPEHDALGDLGVSATDTNLQNRVSRFGKKLAPGASVGFMDRLRLFDYLYPKTAKVAAVTTVIGLSAILGYAVDRLVDGLAHLTERKNDRAGKFVGSAVALLFAGTNLLQLCAVGKRIELGQRWGDLRIDAKAPEGHAFALVEQRSLPILGSLIRNAKSSLGLVHPQLKVAPADLEFAAHWAHRNNTLPEVWQRGIEVCKQPPTEGVFWQNTVHAPHLGLHVGDYLRTRHLDCDHLLEEDMLSTFHGSTSRVEALILDLQQRLSKARITAKVQGRNVDQAAVVREVLQRHEGMSNAQVERLVAELPKAVDGAVKHPLQVLRNENHELYQLLLSVFEKTHRDLALQRSWVRIDELTKLLTLLASMRPVGMHSLMRYLQDESIFFARGSEGATQSRNVGITLPFYLPILTGGALTTNCLLGITATPTPTIAASEGPQKNAESPTVRKARSGSQAAQQGVSGTNLYLQGGPTPVVTASGFYLNPLSSGFAASGA